MTPDHPCQRLPYLKLLRVPPRSKIALVILSEAMEAVPLHWEEGRDQLCPEFIGQPCAQCNAGRCVRWKWYAIVLPLPSSQIHIGYFTDTALAYCPRLQQLASSCRGLGVEVSRGAGQQAPMRLQLLRGAWPADQLLPVAPPLHPQVCRVFGIDPAALPAHRCEADALAPATDADDLIPLPPEPRPIAGDDQGAARQAPGLAGERTLSAGEIRAAVAKAMTMPNGRLSHQ